MTGRSGSEPASSTTASSSRSTEAWRLCAFFAKLLLRAWPSDDLACACTNRQRLVEFAVTREAERLVQMQCRVVVGADVEANRVDASELAEHRAGHQPSKSTPTPVAP